MVLLPKWLLPQGSETPSRRQMVLEDTLLASLVSIVCCVSNFQEFLAIHQLGALSAAKQHDGITNVVTHLPLILTETGFVLQKPCAQDLMRLDGRHHDQGSGLACQLLLDFFATFCFLKFAFQLLHEVQSLHDVLMGSFLAIFSEFLHINGLSHSSFCDQDSFKDTTFGWVHLSSLAGL